MNSKFLAGIMAARNFFTLPILSIRKFPVDGKMNFGNSWA